MAIFPAGTSVAVDATENDTTIIRDRGINFLFDFNAKEFVLKDGKLVGLTGDAAVIFWIEKTLRTEYERALCYWNTEYGFGFERFIGTVLPPEIIKLQFDDNIKKALLQHERIAEINNLTLEKQADSSAVNISFEVVLNPITETEEDYTIQSDETFTKLDTLKEIQDFISVKLLTSDKLIFTTVLGGVVYVKP